MSRGAIAVHLVLFAYLATALGAFWLALKPIPAIVQLAPLAAHAALRIAGAEKAKRALAAFSIWVGLALASTVGMYAAACVIAPPITDDGYRVMPMGQVFSAAVLGPIIGIALGFVLAKKVGPAERARDLVLHALLVLLGAIAIERVLRG